MTQHMLDSGRAIYAYRVHLASAGFPTCSAPSIDYRQRSPVCGMCSRLQYTCILPVFASYKSGKGIGDERLACAGVLAQSES